MTSVALRPRENGPAGPAILTGSLRPCASTCAPRDHAWTAINVGKEPELLPRPSQKQMVAQLKMSASAVSRALGDGSATELRMLWDAAENLNQVQHYRG